MSHGTARIGLDALLLKDGRTVCVRYPCACGCKPQVRLAAGSKATHEHCCCGIAHAGPDARAHLEHYLEERRAAGQDDDRTYEVFDVLLTDPTGRRARGAYAIPVPRVER